MKEMNDGNRIPDIGFGTWMMTDDEAERSVTDAVGLGYRMIDTAQAYENEAGVGRAVRACGIDRKELFIGSKVRAEFKTYDEAKASIDRSLETMGLDYLDQMILHSPQPWNVFGTEDRFEEGNIEAWHALEDARSEGKVRTIGVSNFTNGDLDNIIDNCSTVPAVNQILLHIGRTDRDLIGYCRDRRIVVEAYSPIAHGVVLEDEDVSAMAENYGVSAAQLCIGYTFRLGAVPLPKTSDIGHMKENLDFRVDISDEDMEVLMSKTLGSYGEFDVFPVFSGRPLQ